MSASERDRYPTIFHINVDAFFASVEVALNPDLAGKAVIVGGLSTDRGVVACPNYEARKLGVKTAMPISAAYSLAPDAVFIRGSYRTYENYSRRFIKILEDFSPNVRAASLDEAYLDANGCLHFWDFQPRLLASEIKRAISDELKITVSIGVASNKLCAKVASDYSKKTRDTASKSGPPDGLYIVDLGSEKDFLAPLPVSSIPGIGRRTTEVLNDIGITTVGALAGYDKKSLHEIFGLVGEFLYRAANGLGDRIISSEAGHAKSISRSTTFGEDSDDEDFILSTIFTLSESVASELRDGRLAATTINVKMRYSHGTPILGFSEKRRFTDRQFVTYQKDFTVREPTNSEFEITSVAFELFKSLWLPGKKVRYVGVRVSNIREEKSQLDIFRADHDKRRDLLFDIDKIRGKFGYDSVYFGIAKLADNRRAAAHRVVGFVPHSRRR